MGSRDGVQRRGRTETARSAHAPSTIA